MNNDPSSDFTNAWDFIHMMESDEILISSDDENASVDYWLEQEYMYDCYIQEFAKSGLSPLSLADQMQSLGTNHSTIGTKLCFQLVPKEWNLQTEMTMCKSSALIVNNLPPN